MRAAPRTALLALVTVVGLACAADDRDHEGRCATKELPGSFDGEDLELLRGYTRIGGDLSVPSDTEDLSALGCLERVDGGLGISGLAQLETLDGLENLREVGGGGLGLSELPRLHTVAALTSLREIDGYLALSDLPALSSIDFPTLEHVGGVDLRAWPELQRWDRVLAGGEIGNIRVYELLPGASIAAFAGFERAAEVSIHAWLGADGMPGAHVELDALVSVDAMRLQGLDGGTIASFAALHDAGELSLFEMGGEDLAGLSSLQTVEHLEVSGAPSLRSLAGLEQLTSLTSLRLRHNPLLADVDGLASLRDMPFIGVSRSFDVALVPSIEIETCPMLADLSGLEGLTADTLSALWLVDVPALAALPQLPALRRLGGLYLERTGVQDLDGLAGVTTLKRIAGDIGGMPTEFDQFTIELVGNPALVDLAGLDAVTDAGMWGAISVRDNATLPDCNIEALVGVLDQAGRVDGEVEVMDNGGAGGC